MTQDHITKAFFFFRFKNHLWSSAFDKAIKLLQMFENNRAYSVPAWGATEGLFAVSHIETDMVFGAVIRRGAVPFVIIHASQSILHYPIQSGNLTFIHN